MADSLAQAAARLRKVKRNRERGAVAYSHRRMSLESRFIFKCKMSLEAVAKRPPPGLLSVLISR